MKPPGGRHYACLPKPSFCLLIALATARLQEQIRACFCVDRDSPSTPTLPSCYRHNPRRRSGPIADRVRANPSSFLQLLSRRHIGRTFHFALALNAEALPMKA